MSFFFFSIIIDEKMFSSKNRFTTKPAQLSCPAIIDWQAQKSATISSRLGVICLLRVLFYTLKCHATDLSLSQCYFLFFLPQFFWWSFWLIIELNVDNPLITLTSTIPLKFPWRNNLERHITLSIIGNYSFKGSLLQSPLQPPTPFHLIPSAWVTFPYTSCNIHLVNSFSFVSEAVPNKEFPLTSFSSNLYHPSINSTS